MVNRPGPTTHTGIVLPIIVVFGVALLTMVITVLQLWLRQPTDVRTLAIDHAKTVFHEQRDLHTDMSRGPCLGVVASDWVADVVHVPRQPVDDLSDNQCTAYKEGAAHHFVELSTNGDLVRTY